MQVNYKKFDKALRRLGQDIEEVKLTKDDILALHDLAIQEYGGENGVRDANLLESVCVTPHQSVFGADLYPTIFDKAAKYLLDFSRYQVFVDGNKRTGVLAMWDEMAANGYDLSFTDEEIYALTMDIANNRITELEDVVKVIKEKAFISEEVLKDIEEKSGEETEVSEDVEEEKA